MRTRLVWGKVISLTRVFGSQSQCIFFAVIVSRPAARLFLHNPQIRKVEVFLHEAPDASGVTGRVRWSVEFDV